ncbi:hypothetical protein GX408_16245 [bacterium]|nr:hypothetical protein [bacterium]
MKKAFIRPLVTALTLLLSSSGTPGLRAAENIDFSIQSAVRSADIMRTVSPETAVVPFYQGNGRFGSLYGPLGLHLNPNKPEGFRFGVAQYFHLKHFARAKFGMDYLLPLVCLFWEDEAEKITDSHQHQSFYDGTITTCFTAGETTITVMTWFDPIEKDLCGIKITVDGKAPRVILQPLEKLHVHYRQELEQSSSIRYDSGLWKIHLSCLNATSTLYLQTNAQAKATEGRIYLVLRKGENRLLLSVNSEPKATLDESLSRTIDWWHEKWQSLACLSLPDSNAQNMWVRTMAYLLYSHNEDKIGIAPPMGLTGQGWPFVFPGDLAFLPPVLLATGNLSIVKSWAEYLAERLEGMKQVSKRLYGVDGLGCPATIPYAGFAGYYEPTPPTKNHYSINISGLLARMMDETAAFVNDVQWKKTYAEPVIRETALFYRAISKREADGFWHLHVEPSTGLDENGAFNQKDYLCALFSAQYCFQKAVDYGLDQDGFYRQVLSDGLAFPTLLPERGYYYTNQAARHENAGAQKHPVQLNPLALLPLYPHRTAPETVAYERRYHITINAEQPHFAGWTLAEFLLSGTRIGDRGEWKKDWDNLIRSDLVDPDWIQVYESSGNNRIYYLTTMAMIAQSLVNNLVDDWYGGLEIGRCNPWSGKSLFKNIYSRLGVRVSGAVEEQAATLVLTAWKECDFDLQGTRVKLKKGESRAITVKSPPSGLLQQARP